MHHAGSAEFDPAGAFAWAAALATDLARPVTYKTRKVELGGRLGEREVGRAKACFCLRAKQTLQPFGYSAFQVGHCDAFIDAQALKLMKHRGMRHVWGISAKNFARRKDAKRHAPALHRA